MDLENIYISPLEQCNLNCKYCYTDKTINILTNRQILDFVRNYQQILKKTRNHVFLRGIEPAPQTRRRVKKCDEGLTLKSTIFCGGEVFILRGFPRLVNKLQSMGIFISIITNGTIDRLKEIKDPKNCQLIVSLDGPREVHDHNRGPGNFDKSIRFINHALDLGFPVHIFFLITRDSYRYIKSFPQKLSMILYGRVTNPSLPFTYLTDRLGSLTPDQVKDVRDHYPCFPPKNFGCSMLSLQSDGKIYPCCESPISLGSLSDNLEKIIDKFQQLIDKHPLCSSPTFACHFPPELQLLEKMNVSSQQIFSSIEPAPQTRREKKFR